jgi:hypothetical protein
MVFSLRTKIYCYLHSVVYGMLWLLLCYQAAEMLLLSCLYREKLIDTACCALFEEVLPSVHFGGAHSREFFPVSVLSSF